jgi:molecular chaperone GrpE
MQTEDSEYEPNTVVEEFQKGYKLKDKVIRVSMVKVNQ